MRTTRIWVRRIHKWLGLLIGIQVVLWLSGGVIMSIIPIEMVRGETWIEASRPALQKHIDRFAFPLANIDTGKVVKAARIGFRLGQPAYLLTYEDGLRAAIDATTGAVLPSLDAAQAGDHASAAHVDGAAVLSVERIEAAEGEIRGAPLPLWRVNLDDKWDSRVYLDPVTGRIVAVRNDLWRCYDFFWMLHIMDYGERENFNNNLLRSAAGIGWFIGLTGIWMLFYSFRRQDFGLT